MRWLKNINDNILIGYLGYFILSGGFMEDAQVQSHQKKQALKEASSVPILVTFVCDIYCDQTSRI